MGLFADGFGQGYDDTVTLGKVDKTPAYGDCVPSLRILSTSPVNLPAKPHPHWLSKCKLADACGARLSEALSQGSASRSFARCHAPGLSPLVVPYI